MKLKGGALQFTMYVVVVIALILAGFIIYVHTYKKIELHAHLTKQVVYNSQKGISYMLKGDFSSQDTTEVSLDSENKDYSTVKLHREYWGIFEKVISTAKLKNKTFKKIALLGSKQSKINRTALYLAENNRPLVVVGKTFIQGNVFLPKQGVRTGNISGHSYYGKNLIYGTSYNSKAKLPKFSRKLNKQIERIATKIDIADENQFIDLSLNKNYKNTFYEPSKIIYNPNKLVLSGITLIGNIIVKSQKKIVVHSNSLLKDVILIAPEIEIKPNTVGVFQAFATNKISVGKQCELTYPSVLMVTEKFFSKTNTKVEQEPSIVINENSKVHGAVIFDGKEKNYKAQVLIKDNVEILGEIYCNKNLELLGKVKGSVFTTNFVANQSGSVYQNHLYNGKIIVGELPVEYVGLPLENTEKGIAKWLY